MADSAMSARMAAMRQARKNQSAPTKPQTKGKGKNVIKTVPKVSKMGKKK